VRKQDCVANGNDRYWTYKRVIRGTATTADGPLGGHQRT
jgi:hypothetical protein